MTIDDLVGGNVTRRDAREHIDELLTRPLNDDLRDVDEEASLRDSWGMSDEAIASQESSIWEMAQ